MIIFLIILAIIIILILIGKFSSRNRSEISNNRINHFSNDKITVLLTRAYEKQIIKDYKSAVAICDKVLLLDKDNYDALCCRANCLEALNFNLDAIEDYIKALKIDSSDGNIHGLLGLTYRKIGDIENGQKYLKNSVSRGMMLYKFNYEMLLSASDILKEAFIKKGNNPENLLRRNPNDFVDNLSEVDTLDFNEEVKKQLYHLENAISIDPDNEHLKNLYEFAKKKVE
jgi:tetratricopeptide (TPR) repeat protein